MSEQFDPTNVGEATQTVVATTVEQVESPSEVSVQAPPTAPREESADSSIKKEEKSDVATADTGESGRVVKLLSVGQEVIGTVKRVSEFGAFVDIGVGRDGLVHISELSVRRVGKVADVLQVGQEAKFWIKKLDRERNRISLTMIEPGTRTIRELEKGDVLQGTVTRILPYGAFIDIGIGRDALLHVREMSDRYIAKPEDVVKVGDVIEARIIELSRRRQRVDLSMKGLRPEPEPEPTPEPEPALVVEDPEVEEEEQSADVYADIPVLTPMEMAFKRAMEAEGIKFKMDTKDNKKRKKGGRDHVRSIQDEIIARTLQVSGKQA